MTRRGLLLILSSPSGAGKSTLARMLIAWDPSLQFSVSATTRAPRANEAEGREYYFLSDTQFADQVSAGEMLEHAEVFGNRYGSPAAPVKDALVAGRDMIFDIDWQGGQQIKNSVLGSDAVSVFILPPSIAELERRLRSRAQDTDEVIASRMAKSRNEISHWAEYDYVLVNTGLERCFDELKSILQVERMRRSRQPRLVDLVRTLNAEFASR